MADLTGKVAVVLGASADGGTGWGIAKELSARGAKVVVGARSFEPLQRLAEKIGGLAVRCDAGEEADIQALRDRAVDAYGPIDIAVNSAATPTLGLIAETTSDLLMQGAKVNYFGMAFFVREMAEAMRDGGSIVLISSMTATHPILPHFSYACSKAAMECLVRYAAIEYGPRGIHINGIRIGTVLSDMARELYENPGAGAAFLKEIPLGRFGDPSDMAATVVWLSQGAYISGSILDVSGGNQLNRFPFLSELPGGDESYAGSGAKFDREQGRGYQAHINDQQK